MSTFPQRRVLAITAGLLMVGVIGATAATGSASGGRPGWKGAETFAPTSIGPNPSRCGDFPRNLQATFVGSGIDTLGGPFAVSVSGCLDTESNVLFDLESTDTYLGSGDALRIAPGKVALHVDPVTCVATNRVPVRFDVVGGTGAHTGARGGGHYDIAFTLPTCPGPQQPVHVWFSGHIDTAGPE